MALRSDRTISIVFPAYNEEDNIEAAVEQATACAESMFSDWEVIVVNDGSTDRTGEILRQLEEKDRRLKTVHFEGNGGYGKALRTGLETATQELVFFCDSDLQFHLSELVLLLTWIEQFDYVIGYRVRRSDPPHRLLNAWGWRMLVRMMLGLKVRDIDCAFKVFRREMFDHIKMDAVGAMINTDILVQAQRMGFTCKQVPVTHFPRMKGDQSGANLQVILKAFKELFELRSKLKGIEQIIVPHDRRKKQTPIPHADARKTERRKVKLSINFKDRRRRNGLETQEWRERAS
jgi:glycosyltransferase involved in cell wall biosynthesis